MTAFEKIDFKQGKFYATEKIKKVKEKGDQKKYLFRIKPKAVQI